MHLLYVKHTNQGLAGQCLACPALVLPSKLPLRRHALHTSSRKGPCRVTPSAKRGSGSDGNVWKQLGNMADKYITNASSPRHTSGHPGSLPIQGIHVFLSALVVVWLASTSSSVPVTFKALALEHNWAKWWSVFTDAFCSGSSELLARNLFFGYMFGRVVENSDSTGALWLTVLLSAAGGSVAAWSLLPRRVPIQGCGSTGAIFGLFAMATLFNRRKLWHWQRVFELAVLLPFVSQQLLAGHAGMNQWCLLYGQKMGAWVPLLGGVAGAALAAAVLALVRLLVSSVAAQQRQQQQQQQAAAAGGSAGQAPAAGDDSLSLLLTKALAQMLKRVL